MTAPPSALPGVPRPEGGPGRGRRRGTLAAPSSRFPPRRRRYPGSGACGRAGSRDQASVGAQSPGEDGTRGGAGLGGRGRPPSLLQAPEPSCWGPHLNRAAAQSPPAPLRGTSAAGSVPDYGKRLKANLKATLQVRVTGQAARPSWMRSRSPPSHRVPAEPFSSTLPNVCGSTRGVTRALPALTRVGLLPQGRPGASRLNRCFRVDILAAFRV